MNDIVSCLWKEYHPWVETLSNEEKHAIRKYSWNSQETKLVEFFKRLNSFLRGTKSNKFEISKLIFPILSSLVILSLSIIYICKTSEDNEYT